MKIPVAVSAAMILLATTACGGSPDTAAATDQAATGLQQSGPGTTQGGPGFPGATGKIAAMSGKTLQVQSPMSGQTAVTYTTSTKFSAQVAAKAADLAVGDCVMVTGSGDDTIAATSVRITPKQNGSCTPGRPQGGADGGPNLQGGPPPQQGDAAPPTGVVTMGTFGEVTAVSQSGFTVKATLPGQTTATTRPVTTSSTTTWTDTVAATSHALAVGKCVSAQGDRDSTGAVTATTIAVSDALDGECGMDGLVRMQAQS